MTATLLLHAGAASDGIPIVVAAIAATTALVGATIAAVTAGRRQSSQLKHDRQLADVTELRAVLDAAARNLAAADRMLKSAEDSAHRRGRPIGDSIRDALRESGQLVDDSLQQIRIRLGPSDVTSAYRNAASAYAEFQTNGSTKPESGGDTSLGAARGRFAKSSEAFFQAAYRLVGVSVSEPTRISFVSRGSAAWRERRSRRERTR